ncbi:hypothetical protein [Cellulomonas sp. S1-8]|uniref:hypothetical protein n=1 Tax=Cellulomonas sp. S1-8 TaxID=2904790 RepID=UPI002243213D|nr:hypothetical protein [Cellulomonas sp. S1-8]UZN02536.1 hypothetical protein OKX07_15965 [Cellulomonas sp. S1-8]
MTALAQVALLLTLLAVPALALLADLDARRRTGHGARPRPGVVTVADGVRPVTDLTVVVTVAGDLGDVERMTWLRTYRERVLLVTTGAGTPAAYQRLWSLAGEHGYRVHVAGATGPGAVRSALLRDAHAVLTSEYVVCVAPGAVVTRPLEQVVGALAAARLDVGTLPLAVLPVDVPARLRYLEHAVAARLHRRVPWLVRGGGHVARRTVHADLLRRHSRFGPGDDVETGLLAVARGYRVGHLDVPVVVPAPATARARWREGTAAAAGAFRLLVVNLPVGVRRPALPAALAVLAVPPLLVWSAVPAGWVLALAVVGHGVLTAVLTRDLGEGGRGDLRLRAWCLSPVRAVLRSLLLLPVGCVAYVVLAWRSGNAGVVRPHDAWWRPEPEGAPVVKRLPGPGPARATDWWTAR